MLQRNIQIPAQNIEFDVKPGSARRDKDGHLLVDVVWSTGAPFLRKPYWDEPYIEELSLDPEHVDLSRLNNSAAVLDSHFSYNLRNQIGVVVKDSAVTDGKVGTATLRMSKREDLAGIIQDIEDGIITKISVGYLVRKFLETAASKEGQIRTLKAIDWMPYEISFVCVGADDDSGTRSAQTRSQKNDEKFDCVIVSHERREHMPPENTQTHPTAPAVTTPVQTVDVEAIKEQGREAERAYQSQVRSLVTTAKLGEDVATKFIEGKRSIEDVKSEIITMLTKEESNEATRTAHSPVAITQDEVDVRRRSLESALLHRIDPKNELKENARKFAGLTMIELARELLGKDAQGLDRREIAARALSHSSDLPYVLGAIANKTLLLGYESAPRTFLPLARKVQHMDFKGVNRVQLLENLSLEKLMEGGLIKHGTLGDAKEFYKIASYAKQISFTREMLINDDLDTFLGIPRAFGRSASDLESEIFWEEFQNGIMGDGKAIFHADHNNIITVAADISEDSVDALEQKLANQTKADGKKMNLIGRYLVVPRAKRNKAKKLVASVSANETSKVNVYENSFDIISEVRLSGSHFYLSADYNQIDTFEVAYLQGTNGVSIENGTDFDTRGIQISAVHDFASKCVGHKGLARQTL